MMSTLIKRSFFFTVGFMYTVIKLGRLKWKKALPIIYFTKDHFVLYHCSKELTFFFILKKKCLS